MAKSIRSKVKRSFRSKKRENGVYAATEAARLHRLNSKLVSLISEDRGSSGLEDESKKGEHSLVVDAEPLGQSDSMPIDGTSTSTNAVQRISTHGPRNSRREQWRASKGLNLNPKRRETNRQRKTAMRRGRGRP